MKDDVISRQAAIDSFPEDALAWDISDGYIAPHYVRKILETLPSAQSERMKGKWIRKSPTAWSWTCSCCKRDNAYAYSAGKYYEPDVLQDLFCPNCGADMR